MTPLHELLWLSCGSKRCCSTRTVRPTGGDIWRIATQLHVPPESFLRAIPAEPDMSEGFLLSPSNAPMQVALARRTVKARQATCVFLMQIGDEAARCGLGELRPLACQAFPACGEHGVVQASADHGCTCRTWNLADIERVQAAAVLQQETDERELDRRLIGEWNAQVTATGHTFSLNDFCGYLIHAYADRQTERAARGTL